MQYIACNIETMFEQRLLDVLPITALDRLSVFCRRRQLDRLARTRRSGPALVELREKYADFLKELDLPKPTGGYKRHAKAYGQSAKSPKLSPAQFSSSLRLSPGLPPSPAPRLPPPLKNPSSPALSATSALSPSIKPSLGGDGDTFDIDDFELDASAASTQHPGEAFVPISASNRARPVDNVSSSLPWRQRGPAAAPTTSLKDIMAQESQPRSAGRPGVSLPRRVSSGHPMERDPPVAESPFSLGQRLSQRERKRQPPTPTQVPPNEKPASTSPWRPILPGAWKPPELESSRTSPSIKPSLGDSLGPRQFPSDKQSIGHGRPPIMPAQMPSSRAVSSSSQSHKSSSSLPVTVSGQTVNASGAPVITPTRQQPKRNVSNGNKVPETRSHDTPWVNYTSTVFVPPVESPQGSASFATIQSLQSTEREALQKQRGPLR